MFLSYEQGYKLTTNMKQILHTYLRYNIQFTYELTHLKQKLKSYIIMKQCLYKAISPQY